MKTELWKASFALGMLLVHTAQGVGAAPSLSLDPVDGLLFDEASIELAGALPGTAVSLSASFTDRDARVWSSEAVFFADSAGRVSPARQAAVSGTYTGIDRRGLLWSMLPVPVEQLKATQALPAPDWPSGPNLATDGTVDVSIRAEFKAELEAGKPTVLRAVQRIRFMKSGVRRTQVDAEEFKGVLFEAEGPGPHPAVMVVTGSGGGANERSAALLASHGITALAIAHFNYPGRPAELASIPLEYFYRATDWLRQRARVSRIGLVGGSRGGEGVLLLSAMNPEPFAAVVATVPSNAVWPGCCSPVASAQAAWTLRGEPIEGYRYSFRTGEGFDTPNTGTVDYVRFFLGGMLEPGAAEIPVERIAAPVLLLSGDSDELWPSAVGGAQVLKRLNQRSFRFPAEHIAYPGAGHSATSELLVTSLAHRSLHPLTRSWIPLGGTPALNAAASADAFRRKVAFFKEHLPRNP